VNSTPPYSDVDEKQISRFNFLPVYVLEIIRTFGAGLMGVAAANHLILELNYEPWVASIVSSLFYFGFLLFTLIFGHISDRLGQTQVIRYTFLASIFFGFCYLIPIRNIPSLFLFSVCRFLDGGANGIFWPTVQKFSVVAENYGQKEKTSFLSNYNVGWNIGFLLSMVFGTVALYFVDNNYILFFFNAVNAAIGVGIAFLWLSKISISPRNQNQQSADQSIKEVPHNVSKRDYNLEKAYVIPIFVLIAVLFAHSFTDGATIINIPLKTQQIGAATFWTFAFGLAKAFMMTIGTGTFSRIKDYQITRCVFIGLSGLAIVWLSFALAQTIIIIFVLMIFSGFFQGMIYAIGMRMMSFKAQQQQSARPYAIFQATMGSGRMLGQVNIGVAANFSANLGTYILVIYDCIAIGVFSSYYFKKPASESLNEEISS
jgi:MFS family permease